MIDSISVSKDTNINAASLDIREVGTPEEQEVFKNAGTSSFQDSKNEMQAAIAEGTATPKDNYANAIKTANDYASENYMGALGVIKPYEGLAAQKEQYQKRT